MDMAGVTGRAGRRLLRALTTWPDLAGWGFSAGIGALALAGMGAIGFSTGYYALHPPLLKGLPLRLISVLIAPGLGEEIPFRGLLVPGRREAVNPWPSLVLVTAVFTA